MASEAGRSETRRIGRTHAAGGLLAAEVTLRTDSAAPAAVRVHRPDGSLAARGQGQAGPEV